LSYELGKIIEERKGKEKETKSRIHYGVLLALLSIIVCIMFLKKNYYYGVCLSIGIIIGIIIRYSRFCFAAAFRNLFIGGNTRVLRGIILAMMVSTVGFAVIQSKYPHVKGMDYDLIPGAVSSVGVHVMIGAFIFGIGMVLAGGCASGVLMRLGEGHTIFLVVLLGFIIGTLLGAKDYPFWYEHFIKDAKTIYFPEYLDLRIVVVIQLIVLAALYRLALWYENKCLNRF